MLRKSIKNVVPFIEPYFNIHINIRASLKPLYKYTYIRDALSLVQKQFNSN